MIVFYAIYTNSEMTSRLTRESLLKGRLSTVDLLVLTSVDQQLLTF